MPPQNNQQNPAGPPAGGQGPSLPSPTGAPDQTPLPQPAPAAAPQSYPPADTPKEEENRYAFFMEAKPKAKKLPIPVPSKSNKLMVAVYAAVALFVVLIIGAIIINAANGKKDSSADSLTGIISQQQEILRVTALGEPNVQSTTLINFVSTATITITSSQQDLLTYAAQHGTKIKAKELAAYVADPKTDDTLSQALAASVYDPTFQRTMLGLITEYQASLQRAAAKPAGPIQKDLLQKDLAGAELLHNMLVAQ